MERFFTDKRAPLRMRGCFLGGFLDLFAARLVEVGYARQTIRRQLQSVVRFAHWLQTRDITVHEISLEHVKEYMEQRCQRSDKGVPFTLKRFVRLLAEQGVVQLKSRCESRNPAAELVESYAGYLSRERGLCPSTIRNYTEYARSFLQSKFANNELAFAMLSCADVVRFVQIQAATLGSKRAKLMTTALRSFCQYLRYQGYIDADLKAAVPTVPNWRMADIPRALPAHQVELVLSKCGRRTPTEQRDYAILLLLARLGLRGGEIVSLKLDDIDWEAGLINVRGKGDQVSQLPIPPDVGEAIAFYLKNGRPTTSFRALFLRARAPITGLENQTAVGCLVKRALARAGINSPRKGAHQFRHSLATRMLKQGATLEQIGELLRHQHPQTTEIYAKVDLDSLKRLAMPWPGGVQ